MIIWVDNMQQAVAYPTPRGATNLLMNRNQDIFYVKTVKADGTTTTVAYRFVKEDSCV